jgi:hypothetical protein
VGRRQCAQDAGFPDPRLAGDERGMPRAARDEREAIPKYAERLIALD